MRHFLILLLLIASKYVITAQTSTASVNVSTFSIDAPQLGYAKKIWVWLPKDYASSSAKYPVLYMHDAQNLFDKQTSYAGEWNVDEALDSLNAKVIVVGIEHGNEKRLEELTPFPNEKYGGGKADSYLDFLVNTLMPKVEKKYRVKTGLQNTAIFGSSLGGLVSYYAILKYPKVFGKAGVFSPSFWFSDEIYKMTETAPKIKGKIYFLAGEQESAETVPDLEKIYALMTQNNRTKIKPAKIIVPNGEHNEKLWRENFANAYLWLFSDQ